MQEQVGGIKSSDGSGLRGVVQFDLKGFHRFSLLPSLLLLQESCFPTSSACTPKAHTRVRETTCNL